MSKRTLSRLTPLASIVFLSCCAAAQKQGEQIPPISESKQEMKLDPSIAKLRQLYKAAKSEHERRAVCLSAFDEGAVHQAGSIASLDGVFGTDFASDLPTQKEGVRRTWILFAPQLSSPTPADAGKGGAVGYVGWYMDFDYDFKGSIQNYYLSNLHKGMSSRDDGKEPISVAELRRLYQTAKSEPGRRHVALRAIDEGVIQTFGPVNVSTVDTIFGTRLASQLPTRKEVKRTGIVDFASSPTTSSGTGKDGARTSNGWFMAVEYYSNGNIANYYLTNVRK